MTVAFTHPGKLGDALYGLPTMKSTCQDAGTTCDFYTSSYCASLKRLFENQSFIDRVIIADWYTIRDMGMGCQPWEIPIPDHSQYSAVYHLGLRSWPDQALHQFIWKQTHGFDRPLSIEYECADLDLPKPYYCLATRGHTSHEGVFREFVERSPIPVKIIGGEGDYLGFGDNLTELDFLDTCSTLKGASGFIGLMSSQLVLANGFSYPKIAVYPGHGYDMRHVIQGPSNHYLVNPSADQILYTLGAV